MVFRGFGLSERQNAIMAHLYSLKDTPKSPPDPRASLSYMARCLGITQKEVREETRGLIKKRYVGYAIIERERHFYLAPLGISEMEKHIIKKTEFEVSSEKIGIKGERTEEI